MIVGSEAGNGGPEDRPPARREDEGNLAVGLAAALALAGVLALAAIVVGLATALALTGILAFAIVLALVGVIGELAEGVVHAIGRSGDGIGVHPRGGTGHESGEGNSGEHGLGGLEETWVFHSVGSFFLG